MSDKLPTLTDAYQQGRDDEAIACRTEVLQTRGILLDLIAELRRSAKGYLSPGAYAITVKEQLWMADRAEARLREIEGEHR